MSKHTPTPWKVTGGNIITAPNFGWKGAIVATVSHRDIGSNTSDTIRAEANAKLIVRAVNNFTALLAALKAAAQAHGPFGDDSRPEWWVSACVAVSNAEMDVETDGLAVNCHDEMLAEIKKQIDWLKHIRPELTGKVHGSIIDGVDQSIKYMSMVVAKAEGQP